MAHPRIPAAQIRGPPGALIKRASRRQLGRTPESLGVMWHNRRVLMSLSMFGRKAERKWSAFDTDLKLYAHMATASLVGCTACLDFGYLQAHNHGLDERKASQVPQWRESDVFTPLERDVMEYAEAMTQTPPTVTEDLSARLLTQLGAPALIELSAWIGFANACRAALAAAQRSLS
ncbi:MAG: carboxymuconolactone decarboxylase family protein [Acidimicrobiales bacterium]